MIELRKKRKLTTEDMQGLWDEYYRKGYEKMSLTIPSQNVAREMIDSLIPCPGGIVLDGGCGSGLNFKDILDRTKAARLFGGDNSNEMLEGARKNLKRLPDIYEKSIKLVPEIKMLGANNINYNMKKQTDAYETELEKNQESPADIDEDEDVGMIPNIVKLPDTVEEFLAEYGTDHRGETWWDEAYATYITEKSKDKEDE